jgi:hypothetical protein
MICADLRAAFALPGVLFAGAENRTTPQPIYCSVRRHRVRSPETGQSVTSLEFLLNFASFILQIARYHGIF